MSRDRIVGFVVAACVCIAVFSSGVVDRLSLKLLDWQFSTLRVLARQPVSNEVVVVGIDEDTIKKFSQPISLWHPQLGKFLELMAVAQPTVVGIDLVLPDRSYDSFVPGYDRMLLTGLLATKGRVPVVLGQTVEHNGIARPMHLPFVSLLGTEALGYALFPLDVDQVVRRFDERLGDGGGSLPTLVGQMARKVGIAPSNGIINYALGERFSYISLARVLNSAPAELNKIFYGKAVLLGVVLRFEDRLKQPLNMASWEPSNADSAPGVLVHAQALRSQINQGMVSTAPPYVMIPFTIGVAALFWLIGCNARRAVIGGAAFAGIAMAAAILGLSFGWFIPLVGVLLTACVFGGARVLLSIGFELRERARLRRAFAGYVSPKVMAGILSGEFRGGLGGERQKVCVLFADIRGFTALSENMPPEQVISLLNRYFEAVVIGSIHAEGGTVTSLMGDGVMALFGAPQPFANPSANALAAAQRMLSVLPAFNTELKKEGLSPMSIGIGLNSGEVVVGHIGSMARHEYTAIGDTINVASRVEGLSQTLGFSLLCTRRVVDDLGGTEGFVALGDQSIKGHSQVELFGWRADSKSA